MPNIKHGPRGGPKKTGAGSNNAASTSVDAGRKEKMPRAATQQDMKDKKAKQQAGQPEEAANAPKKPDTRTLIGGASWTGKLPVNLLSEQCQKRKWDKPEYIMRGNPQHGFTCSVILRNTNPKTGECTQLPPFEVPGIHRAIATQPTALEARHFAATFTLFRICSMQNLHMMMPPKYKDFWKGTFQDIKKSDVVNGEGWMYDNDPFATHEERRKEKVAAKKKAEELERQRKKEAASPNPRMPGHMNGFKQSRDPRGDHRAWENAVDVQMGNRTRIELEKLIRKYAIWNPHGRSVVETTCDSELYYFFDDLTRLGFRKSHIEEAANICRDREEVLQWLMVHVPEDDLPAWTLPTNYTAGVTLVSNDLQRNATVKRLAISGYSVDLVEEMLDSCDGDEAKAASLLQNRLLQRTDDAEELLPRVATLGNDNGSDEAWNDEKSVLASIYNDKFRTTSADTFEIQFDPEVWGVMEMTLYVRKPLGDYPNVLPIVGLKADHPCYIRLSILKKALLHAREHFLGEQMVFNIIDWISHNAEAIIENPGRLMEVSTVSAARESALASSRRPEKRRRTYRPINWIQGTATSTRLLEERKSRQQMRAQQHMFAKRQALPAWKLQEKIVYAVRNNQVTIISGETGSGKSTQSVQFILDDLITREFGEAANIICTQPRRISALGLADRVADERCGQVGQEVGYIIRGESKVKPGVTKITFVTTGVLLRRLQMSGGKAEDVIAALADVSHVVVDEVHERSLDTDFLLILLRDVLKARRDLKVVLMSATLDADVYTEYFKPIGPVARVEIEGRTHPVTDYYLDDVVRLTGFSDGMEEEERIEDQGDGKKSIGQMLRSVGTQINYDLIAATVRHIDQELGDKDGGVLIFLPGTLEIDRTIQTLRKFTNIHALPLHASLTPEEQRRVFASAPAGLRKVIAATNVAETSITIEDIVAVIDTGRVKETFFDPQNNMVKLEEVWASKAACKQRRGRAGRVRAGKCYKLYTKAAEERMLERPEPEIRRVPLEQLCLSVKAMGIADAPAFLAEALTPPDSLAVEGAAELLRRMGALEGDDLTGIGRHLSMIPADLRCGKLLVYGAIFGCLEACLTMASILSVRSPFLSPRDKREEAKAARAPFGQGNGDLIADLRAYEQWSALRAKGLGRRDLRLWCEDNFIHLNSMYDISSTRSQFVSSLKEIGFLPLDYRSVSDYTSNSGSYERPRTASLNAHSGNTALLRALIAGAFTPQIARISFPSKRFAATTAGAVELDPEARAIKFFNQDNGRVFVHPSSTLFGAQQFPGSNSSFVSYFEKVATSKVFVRGVTPFNAMSLLMFGGKIEVDDRGRGLVVDGWATLRGWARIGVLASRLRIILDGLLATKIDDPGLDVCEHEVVAAVRKLIEFDGLDR